MVLTGRGGAAHGPRVGFRVCVVAAVVLLCCDLARYRESFVVVGFVLARAGCGGLVGVGLVSAYFVQNRGKRRKGG